MMNPKAGELVEAWISFQMEHPVVALVVYERGFYLDVLSADGKTRVHHASVRKIDQ